MCGIAGICHITNQGGISPAALQRMVGAMRHRGPDESGIYVDDRVGLGHARLSIIDLSSGTQPIHNEDKTKWIVYNGEVFNYVELRQTLEAAGHHFYTTSDTEVILHLYEDQGERCVSELNGQFAFAIWDSKKQELFLARDRVGIRPLYYTVVDDKLIFGSEIKSMFTNDCVRREVDAVALEQIFTFWTTLRSRTFFKGVSELEPGHFMKIADGRIAVRKYWDLPFYPRGEQLDCSTQEICEQIHELLLDAVRIRLRADVPVGTYLSGGLDSSGVTTLVVKNFDSDVRTFGIRFEESQFDEGGHQGRMVSFLNANHTEIRATNEKIGRSLPDCLWHCEKPLLRTAPVPLYLLSQLVRDSGLKVVLTGEGADEVFGGYNIFREAKVRRFWSRLPESEKRASLIGRLYPYIFDNPRLKQTLQAFFARGLSYTDDPLYSHCLRWENTRKITTFLSDRVKSAVGDYDGYDEVRASLPEAFGKWDHLSQAQYLEMTVFLSNYLLSSQGDRMAMAHSVEIRLPYLDYRLMELMGRVPSRWKVLGLQEKYILKKFYRGILPDEIALRSKHPYRAPIKQSLLDGNAGDYVRDVLSESALARTSLFDAKKVGRLVKKLEMTENPSEMDNMALIGILSSQLTYHQFVEDYTSTVGSGVAADVIVDRRSKAVKDGH